MRRPARSGWAATRAMQCRRLALRSARFRSVVWCSRRARHQARRRGAHRGAAMVVRVLIVDDHGVVRRGLRMFLEDDPEIDIVGEARDGAEAVAQAQALKPDVVLMDLLMPVMDGIAATGIIRRELPDTEVIALTSV